MNNKIQIINILGHTVKWWCTGAGSPITELPKKISSYIAKTIEAGYEDDRYWLSNQGIHIEWEIVDWKRIADKLYKELKWCLSVPQCDDIQLKEALEMYEKAIEDGK